MNGDDFIYQLQRKLELLDSDDADQKICEFLGIRAINLQALRRRTEVKALHMANLLMKFEAAATKRTESAIKQAERKAIQPIVEYFKLAPTHGANPKIFGVQDDDGVNHPYHIGLKAELESHRGIYIFYDSRGRALYVGKTVAQTLWREINLAFNRDRGDVQKIRRVDHELKKKKPFLTSEEKARQIKPYEVPLHELAWYLSAYRVADGLIKDMEALLIRGAANDLLNIKMEKITPNT